MIFGAGLKVLGTLLQAGDIATDAMTSDKRSLARFLPDMGIHVSIRPRHVRLRLAELSQNARRSRGEPRDAIGRPGREDSRRFLTRQPDRHIGEREFRKVVKIACEGVYDLQENAPWSYTVSGQRRCIILRS